MDLEDLKGDKIQRHESNMHCLVVDAAQKFFDERNLLGQNTRKEDWQKWSRKSTCAEGKKLMDC